MNQGLILARRIFYYFLVTTKPKDLNSRSSSHNSMVERESVDLESRTAYLGRFGVLKDAMNQGVAAVSYLKQPIKNPSLILRTSDTINSSALKSLAMKIELYDSLLETTEKKHGFKRPSLTGTNVHYSGDPYFFDTEEIVDWLGAYSNYLAKKKDPKQISSKDLAHFLKQPLSSDYKILKPKHRKKSKDIVDKTNDIAEGIVYVSFLGIISGVGKVFQVLNSAYDVYKKFDSWLDRKFFDKYKVNSSGKFE